MSYRAAFLILALAFAVPKSTELDWSSKHVRVMVSELDGGGVTVDCLEKEHLAYAIYPGPDDKKVDSRIVIRCVDPVIYRGEKP